MSLTEICRLSFALLLVACGVSRAQEQERTAGPAAETGRATMLDGRRKSFVIVGYSTSYAWPTMLQQMLDEHSGVSGGAKRVYYVLNAVAGGAAVERWLDEPGSRHYERTIGAMKRDFFGKKPELRGDAPAPTIALCQQSLQFTRTQRGPVTSAGDREGIRIGADALERLVLRLRDLGIEKVVYGMHIYKKPVEPEVGNERLALQALLGRGHRFVVAGPDVWEPTKARHKECFAQDGVHPNELGMKIMAEGWYRTVAGSEVKKDVIERMHARPYDIRRMMRDYLAWRRGESVELRVRLRGKEPERTGRESPLRRRIPSSRPE